MDLCYPNPIIVKHKDGESTLEDDTTERSHGEGRPYDLLALRGDVWIPAGTWLLSGAPNRGEDERFVFYAGKAATGSACYSGRASYHILYTCT